MRAQCARKAARKAIWELRDIGSRLALMRIAEIAAAVSAISALRLISGGAGFSGTWAARPSRFEF